jgi:hypothetical protein
MIAPPKLVRSLSTAVRILREEGPRGVRVAIHRKIEAKIKERDLGIVLSRGSLRDRFSEIHKRRYWHSARNYESRSGYGSTRAFAEPYVGHLDTFLNGLRHKYASKVVFFDAPCGDFNWIHSVARRSDVCYIGADIVPSIVAVNNRRYASPSVRFIELDITTDQFPNATLWHCRDCLIHLSFANIMRSLKNFVSSRIELVLVTCHHLKDNEMNIDISDGDFRHLDFRKPPFVLPAPIEVIPDSPPSEKIPRFTYVYTRSQIAGWLA